MIPDSGDLASVKVWEKSLSARSNNAPLLLLEIVHLSSAFEHPHLASRFLEYVARGFLVVLLELHQLVGAHAYEGAADVVEAAEPELSSMVAGID